MNDPYDVIVAGAGNAALWNSGTQPELCKLNFLIVVDDGDRVDLDVELLRP
jgi:hypothetical protein